MSRWVLTLCLLLTETAYAALIVIEPDDFAVGEQITSEHARVVFYDRYVSEAVYAKDGSRWGYQAPTGSNVFGTSVTSMGDRDDVPEYGLTFEFFSPVKSVTIWTLNYDYHYPLGIESFAWTSGLTNPRYGGASASQLPYQGVAVQYTFEFNGTSFDRLSIGGDDTIAAILFDRLEAVTVPAPSTLHMLAIGLVLCLLAPAATKKQAT